MNTKTISRQTAQPQAATLAQVIATATAEWGAFGDAAHLDDAIALGREPNEDESARFSIAEDRAQSALAAVLDYPARTADEVVEIAAFVGGDDAFMGLEARRRIGLMAKTVLSRRPPQAAWDEALAAYEAARDAANACRDEIERWEAAEEEAAPMPASLRISDHQRFASEHHIRESDTHTVEQKVALLADMKAWDAAKANFRAAANFDPDAWERRSEALYDVEGAAEHHLLLTPPPTLEAMLLKTRLLIDRNLIAQVGEHPDDPTYASRMIDPSGWAEPDRLYYRAYLDLLQLAGQHTPALDAEPFDPEVWVAAFEALPGHEISEFGVAYIEPEAFVEGREPAGHGLWSALAEWQRDKVIAHVKDRNLIAAEPATPLAGAA